MSDDSNEVEMLDGMDTGILNRQGWHFVTYFQTREGGEGSSAYNKARERAKAHNRPAGIRTVVKDGITYWEIWEHW